MLLQRNHNTCYVPYPSFPLINNCSIKHKVCTESACPTQARLAGQSASGKRQRLEAQQLVTTGQPGWQSWKSLLQPRDNLDGNPGSRSYMSMEICAQALPVRKASRVSKK